MPESITVEKPPVGAWVPGEEVGRYTLLAKLATGGMAEIWLARHAGPERFEKVVVIKRILDTLLEDEEIGVMFLDEARIAAQLSHPNIVQIYDLGQHAGAHYMVMEYLAGEDLAKVVRAGRKADKPLPLAMAVRLVATAAEALGHAHTKVGIDGKPLGIVHRDVSPQNLIITYEGVVKVVDFGIAKAASRITKTGVGTYKGKLAYMAPEQARSGPVDGRSDVFPLGIVLFEAVTRTRLFSFDDPLRGLLALSDEKWRIPLAWERNPTVPDDLSEIIAKALQRDPEKRYQSAREFQLALEDWLRKGADTPGNPEISAYMHELFAERIAARVHLLESAISGDLARVKTSPGSDSVSMPGSHSNPKRRVPKKAILAAGAGSLLLLAVILFAALGGREPPTPIPAPVVQPLPPAVLVIDSEPPAAAIEVDGVERGTAPVTIQPVAIGQHRVVARLAGHQDNERTIQVEHDGTRTNLQVALQPLPPAPPAKPAPGPVRPKAVVKKGRLTLSTSPWARVYLGERKLGDTPLVGVVLPAGRHSLRLVNAEEKIDKKLLVEIRADETTVRKEKL